MSETLHLRPPQYIDQVETLINLPFFSDPLLERQVRINPGRIEPEILAPRVGIYVGGLRLLRNERLASTAPEPQISEEIADRRLRRARSIGTVRGELMLLDPELETPEVKTLRSALGNWHEEHTPTPFMLGESRPTDILPPWRLPVQAVNSIVQMSSGGVLHALKHRGITPPKLKLPGIHPSEVCCDWDLIRELADLHGLRPEIEGTVDLTKLPRTEDDADPDRLAYARELQLRFVDAEKLRNIPELEALLPPKVAHPIARPYHISRAALDRLMGGGYHFIDAYCKEHGMGYIPLRRPGGAGIGIGKYMLLEEAAEIWKIYDAVPVATAEDITIIRAATNIEVAKKFFRAELTADEAAVVTDMRALEPPGRVLPHLPVEVARNAMNRLRRGPLLPHLIPAQVLDKYFAITYSGVMNASYEMGISNLRCRLFGTNKTQSCFTWESVRQMQQDRRVKLRDGAIGLDFDMLPMDENDLDPEHIMYARYMQSLLVNDPRQVDTTPVEVWIAERIAAKEAAIMRSNAAIEEAAIMVDQEDPLPLTADYHTGGISSEAWASKAPAVVGNLPDTPYVVPFENPKPRGRKPEHRDEEPGSWQPSAVAAPGVIISSTDRLTAYEIGDLLGIEAAVVTRALEHIDPGDVQFEETEVLGQMTPIYKGSMLIAIRQQLMGIPLEYMARLHGLRGPQIDRARRYLEGQGYESFAGDHFSPGAFKLLGDNVAHIKANTEEIAE